MFDPLSTNQQPSIPFSLPGLEPPGPTGNVGPVGAPGVPSMSSPLAGPAPLFPAVGQFDPRSAQYDIETQIDGTLLLRLRLPDGSRGPVVAHLPVPKLKGVQQ